jgi:hypothetical protein
MASFRPHPIVFALSVTKSLLPKKGLELEPFCGAFYPAGEIPSEREGPLA